MPELSIDINEMDGGQSLVKLGGFLDAHTFEQLDESIQDIFDSGVSKIIVDLAGVEYISSAGAGVFIGSLALAQEKGGNIVLVNPTENVKEVFDLLGLSQIFTITASVAEAQESFV